ncbi:pyocin killing protein [Pseudomonas fluorescens]|uniref:Pyocin killing protein n=1 Tax=Pseudomonas fluorescens TaxID=294 RepID=A0A379IAX8_PSEFL|nr:hypothetical protein HZ99_25950 [Pseudomonas fluorescens]ONH42580.1 hypothetical protein BLL38_13490 [Pseudomonas gessardii]SUD29841.1 pyocin killing protein [Pseudomonas fluorescens]
MAIGTVKWFNDRWNMRLSRAQKANRQPAPGRSRPWHNRSPVILKQKLEGFYSCHAKAQEGCAEYWVKVLPLRGAVNSNVDSIKRGLLEEGYSDAEIEVAREQLHQLNQQQGWY